VRLDEQNQRAYAAFTPELQPAIGLADTGPGSAGPDRLGLRVEMAREVKVGSQK